jgi:2'-hydroxyisoflavone reductase
MSSFSRRDFLATSAATAAGFALASRAFAAGSRGQPDAAAGAKPAQASKKLKLLILGGTHITGPFLVRMALDRGHTVTVFNRGKTEKRIGALPDGVEKLLGDRDPKIGDGLKALQGDRTWDAVVDTSGQFPRIMRASNELLAKRVGHYTYISSISAYKSPVPKNSDESAPLATLDDPETEDMGADFHNYGGLKAACEKVVEGAFSGRCAIVRPTFISGPGDETDRFGYFPIRVSRGGEMLCPGTPSDPMQFIDSRDLAAWLLHISENSVSGVYNAAGPHPACTIGELLRISKEVSKADTTFTWVPGDFIDKPLAPAESPKRGMSIWVPPDGEEGGMSTVKIDRALGAGLKLRPVRETVKDTLAWWPQEVARRERVGNEMVAQAKKDGKLEPHLPDPHELRAGPTPEEEKALLAAWHEQEKKGAGGKPG